MLITSSTDSLDVLRRKIYDYNNRRGFIYKFTGGIRLREGGKMKIKYYCQDRFGNRTAEAESMTALAKMVGDSISAVSRGVTKFNQGQPSRYGCENVDDGEALEFQKGYCKYCKRELSKGAHLCSECRAKLKLVRKIIAIGKLMRKVAEKNEKSQS